MADQTEIPDEAVEAAAQILREWTGGAWTDALTVRRVLAAALPLLTAGWDAEITRLRAEVASLSHDLVYRLAAADQQWCAEIGDTPATPQYLHHLAEHVTATRAHVHADACMCVMAPMEVEGAYECNHCGDHFGGVCTALCEVARQEFDLAHPARQWAVRHPDVELSVHRSPHSVLYTASKLPGGVIVTRLAGQEEWVPETACLCGDRKPADHHFECCPDTTPPVREPRVWRSDAEPEPEDTPTVKDSMGDVWTNDPRLWVTPDTQPMTWARIAKKYGPLTEVVPVSTPGGES